MKARTIKNNNANWFLFRIQAHSEENSVPRHTIKALVKEPAISDSRLQSGDKLLSANGVPCDTLSHPELIQFLRQCPDRVVLRLYRDDSRSQTPVSPHYTPQQNNSSVLQNNNMMMNKSLNSTDGMKNNCSFHDSDSALNLSRHKQLR